ncbi:hypothetical protein F5884DRAFT_812695 [Xylogone sp. PMI_703]|nr:hypothetical protein F5884DRAFT_812695 [Xylogone sp. PMI_703]
MYIIIIYLLLSLTPPFSNSKMLQSILFVFSLLVGAYTVSYQPPGASCQDFTVPIAVSIPALTWTGSRWTNDFELIDFVATESGRNALPSASLWSGPSPFTGSYDIAATFCTPTNTTLGREKKILLATHGLWFSGSYWNTQFEPKTYNFVQRAIIEGYSVFFYDRLGVNNSTQISGFEAQGLVQVEVLRQLSSLVNGGTYTGTVGKPSSLILVGHAFGSFLSSALLTAYPDSADAAVFTTFGWGLNQAVFETITPRIAAYQNPGQWGHLDPGYITWVDKVSNVGLNFKLGGYANETVDYIEETKTPFALQEPITQGLLDINATEFTGPIFILNGEYAITVCDGYCPGITDEPARDVFHSSINFTSYVLSGCAHTINYCTGASEAFSEIFGFLNSVI